VPIDCNHKNLGLVTIAAGSRWLRVHGSAYGPTEFNGEPVGNARFSPIRNAQGLIIPTLYAAQDDVASALMETVLHDVPTPSAGFIYVAPATEDRQLATLVNQVPLQLGNLQVMGLKRLGLSSAAVVDGDKPTYGDTRGFAQALHAARGDIQGLIWDSRQTKKEVIVLFEDRLPADALACIGSTPVTDRSVQSILYDLLEILGASAI
jgi:hypothetical protein